jgi:hypothetical protein
MKPLAPLFSFGSIAAIAAGAICATLPRALSAAVAAPSPAPLLPPDLVADAAAVHAYPTFCAIPAAPTNVRTASAFKALVVDTRVAGARVVASTAPSTFSLTDTEAFAAAARAFAAPPAPMSSTDQSPTEAFATSARDRALPPRRP